jgi:hypothetical protein
MGESQDSFIAKEASSVFLIHVIHEDREPKLGTDIDVVVL